MMNQVLLEKIERYFLLQQELYGNIVYYNPQNRTKFIEKKITENIIERESIFNKPVNVELFKNGLEWQEAKSLTELNQKICNCQRCPLGQTRTNFVFGKGNPNADIIIIGEAPGADEDAQGEPFVGRAGQLLTKILNAINLTREEVFICNILKCRPPNNRKPEVTETEICEQYLIKQIELIKPKFILTLGLTAVETLLKKKFKMGEVRGSIMSYNDIKMLVTYHPAALLRNPNWKTYVWEDVKLLRKLYDEYLESQNK